MLVQKFNPITCQFNLVNTDPMGPVGATGTTGAQGIPGAVGTTGAQGPTGPASDLIITSPNSTRYRIIVDNSGNLSTESVI